MRPELLAPADVPADDRPSTNAHRGRTTDRDGSAARAAVVPVLSVVALLVAAPALLVAVAAAAAAVGMLVGLPVATWRAWLALDRARTSRGVN